MTELNPDGIRVGGVPFWNGVHRAWWIRPDVKELCAAFETTRERRADVDPVKLRESVARYAVDVVAEEHMRPAVDVLLERMAGRAGIPAAASPAAVRTRRKALPAARKALPPGTGTGGEEQA